MFVVCSTQSLKLTQARNQVEFCRARAFVRGHDLRVLQSAAGLKIGRDAGSAESVAADPNSRAEISRAALNHAPGVNAVHHFVG